MVKQLADDALCEKGFQVLERELGPVQALRFLSLISRESFDYQRWREQHFGEMELDDILSQARAGSHSSP